RLMKTRYRWGIVIAVIAIAGGGWMAFNRGPQPTEIQVATVGRSDLKSKVSANGKVQAQQKVDISATVAGRITYFAVKEGGAVEVGHTRRQSDAASPRAWQRSAAVSMKAVEMELDSARASLAQNKADLRRADENFQGGIIPVAELERARTAVATSEAG